MPQRRLYGDADHDGAPKSDAPGASNVIPMKPKRSVIARPNAEERAFLPAMLEVIETPPSPTLRYTALALCGFVAIALAWASLSKVDMIAVAEGKVVPMGQVKVVQPLETAVIRTIHVDEGDHVQAGQLLVELDPTEIKADLDALLYDQRQAALDAELARILLTVNPDEPFHAPEGVDPVVGAASENQARNEITKHLAILEGNAADISQKRATLDVNAVQMERARRIIPLLSERRDDLKVLYDKKYGNKPPLFDAEQQLVEKQSDFRAAEQTVRQIEAEIRSLESKSAETRAAFLADAADRRLKALQKLSSTTHEIIKARQKETYRRLLAPVAGTVQGIKIHTPGAVVTTADTLMTIVPDGTGIEIDAQVLNKDIGFVSEGQDVEIKFDAFPFTRYGLIKGKVRKLGRDAASNGQSGIPGTAGAAASAALSTVGANGANGSPTDLAYPAKVTLLQDWIAVDNRQEQIRPGMHVSAEIKTGDRRIIEFVLSPILQTVKEAGRER
jgi:hemolysin D